MSDKKAPKSGGSNPWRQLAATIQSDLKGPLGNRCYYPWLTKNFDKWFEQYYTEGGKPKSEAGNKEEFFAEYFFDHEIDTEARNGFLALYTKLKAEGLWDIVEKVKWIGGGAILFKPKMSQDDLKKHLKSKGYGDWWFASRGNPWGVRSRFSGVQLHFRGGEFINAHLDLHNPGDPPSGEATGGIRELGQALKHKVQDDWRRGKTHNSKALREGLEGQGLKVPKVD